jgi:fumarate reductase flavoprotein subunit
MKNLRKVMAGTGILLLVIMVLGFTACSSPSSSGPRGEDGNYTETIRGHLGDITVNITVEGHQLAGVEVLAPQETPGLGGAAAQRLGERILETKSVDLDVVSGASITSAAVLAAARSCFDQAGLPSAKYTPTGTPVVIDGYDVVVVGGGASGFAATLAAHEKGAKVLVLEQTGQLGGLSLTAFGILGAQSSQQKNGNEHPFGMYGMPDIDPLTQEELDAVSVDSLFNWIHNEYNHFRSNGVLVRAILEKSGDTIDWLNANGIQTTILKGVDQGRHVDYPKTYHMWGAFNMFSPVNSFTQVWRRLQDQDPMTGLPNEPAVESNPIRVELYTRGQKLITSGGAVTGVEAVRDDGSRVIVHANQVILTTGGYGADTQRFRDRGEVNYYNYFGYGNHGDGIKMALEVGADEFNDNVIQIHMSDPAGTPAIGSAATFALSVSSITDLPHLWVDLAGTRFTDESAVYDNVFWGNAAYSVGGKYFAIFDQATIDALSNDGAPYLGGYGVQGVGYFDFAGDASNGLAKGTRDSDTYILTPGSFGAPDVTVPMTNNEFEIKGIHYHLDAEGYVCDVDNVRQPKVAILPLNALPNLQGDLDTLLVTQPGTVFKGQTLAELAANTGMDAAKLQASVTKYNTAVTNQEDTQFFKSKKYLSWKVETGPFYAVAMQGSTYGSIGGVRVNENIQALDSLGKVVPNLYVGGADAGGMWDSSYPDLEGLSQAFAMNSGRIAGENAAEAAGY